MFYSHICARSYDKPHFFEKFGCFLQYCTIFGKFCKSLDKRITDMIHSVRQLDRGASFMTSRQCRLHCGGKGKLAERTSRLV